MLALSEAQDCNQIVYLSGSPGHDRKSTSYDCGLRAAVKPLMVLDSILLVNRKDNQLSLQWQKRQ